MGKTITTGFLVVFLLSLSISIYCAVLDFDLVPEGQTPQGWFQHGHDAQRTSYTDQVVSIPWRWKWSWNGPNASGGVSSGKHRLPRGVQPIPGGGRVYIADGSYGMRALDINNGSVLWTVVPGGSGNCNATPAYDPINNVLFVPSTNNNLYKLNPSNGAVLGTFNASAAISVAPCMIDDRVFISAGNYVRAVRKSDMTQIWAYDAGSPCVTMPSYSPSRNCVIVVSQDLYVHAINNSDGTRKWRVKPTVRNYQSGVVEASWAWPVIAEVHGYVLVKYRLDWNTLWTWSPWPTSNTTIRTNLQNQPDQQALFCLDLDDGSVPFICNVGNGGWGDGDYLPMGPSPVVKKFSDGTESVFTIIRGGGYDGRGDSHPGEMVLDNTTATGFNAGYIRWIQYGSDWGSPYGSVYFHPSDEQPFPSMAGDYFLFGHWMMGTSLQITDRSGGRGTYTNPILSGPIPAFVTSTNSSGGPPSYSSTHYWGQPLAHIGPGEWRQVAYGFYIYWDQGNLYDSYWSDYACWTIGENHVFFRSCDTAIICLENGNPGAKFMKIDEETFAKCIEEEKELISGENPSAKDRPSTGFDIISFKDARNHPGELKTVEGRVQYTFNNGKAVYLCFKQKPHQGEFLVRIMKDDLKNFSIPPEILYNGRDVKVTGKIRYYQGDPVIYVTNPSQIEFADNIQIVFNEQKNIVNFWKDVIIGKNCGYILKLN